MWGVDLIEAQVRSSLGLPQALRPSRRPRCAVVDSPVSAPVLDQRLDARRSAAVVVSIFNPDRLRGPGPGHASADESLPRPAPPVNATIEQIAEHQALFRAVNEHTGAQPEYSGDGASLIFHCECADLDCRTRLRLSHAQYEAVRADSARFIVAPGHVFPEAERVIEEHDGCLVVEKNADVRAILERTDPRAVRAE